MATPGRKCGVCRRSLTGAWIETINGTRNRLIMLVAPLRGRGLKLWLRQGANAEFASRSLTGAWIETDIDRRGRWSCRRRSLTGAWIETLCFLQIGSRVTVAPLRGRGLKHGYARAQMRSLPVAPLRGRGLKPLDTVTSVYFTEESLPYGGVD